MVVGVEAPERDLPDLGVGVEVEDDQDPLAGRCDAERPADADDLGIAARRQRDLLRTPAPVAQERAHAAFERDRLRRR
jgi:hypothetical protein